MLDALPIVAFFVAAYVALALAQPAEKVRLVAIAWINAAVIVRGVLAVNRFFFAPQQPSLRFLPVEDATAQAADAWVRHFSITAVYGYLALQAAFLGGLPRSLYETAVRLLGLVLSGLVVVLIMRNRRSVAQMMRGLTLADPGEPHPLHILRWLAPVWHILAVAYVFLLYGTWALAYTGGTLFILQGTLLTLFILVAGGAGSWFLDRGLHRGLHMEDEMRRRLAGLETRVNRYLPAMRMGVRVVIVLLMALAILQAWDVPTFAWLTRGLGKVLSLELARIGGIVLFSLLLWEAFDFFIEHRLGLTIEGRGPSARMQTLLTVGRNALFVILTVMATLMVLSDLGINITPLLAGASVVGLAVGFGAQKLVRDIITGGFILFEDQIAVGDVASLAGVSGVVEAITIRTVRLRDLSGNVHTVPFSSIGTITNMARDFAYYVFDVSIDYREDADAVMTVLKAIGAEMQQDPQFGAFILEPLEVLGVDAVAGSGVIIKARVKTRPLRQWDVGREFNRRMTKRFNELDVEPPSSSITVYFGGDEDGKAQRVRFGGQAGAQPAVVASAAEPPADQPGS